MHNIFSFTHDCVQTMHKIIVTPWKNWSGSSKIAMFFKFSI
jgi:hypothetical protein